jgi:hypothetical protein
MPFSHFSVSSKTSVRVGISLHFASIMFGFYADEFYFNRQFDRQVLLSGGLPLTISLGLLHLDILDDPDLSGSLPDGINKGCYTEMGKLERAKAFKAVLPQLPFELNAAMHFYLMQQLAWICDAILSPSRLLNPSNYLRLIDVHKNLTALTDVIGEFRTRDEILVDVLCTPELFEVMIPIIGDKRWAPQIQETLPGRQGRPVLALAGSQEPTYEFIPLFLGTAFKYPPAISVFISALRVKRTFWSSVLKQLSLSAQVIAKSPEFEELFSTEILPQALSIGFRTNPRLMKNLAKVVVKYCRDDEGTAFSPGVSLLVLFLFLDGGDQAFDGAVHLAGCLSDEAKESIVPYVRCLIEKFLAVNSSTGHVHWLKICRVFRNFAGACEANLNRTLDSLLESYRPSQIAEIGALLNVLVPKRRATWNITESRSVDVPLNISPGLYAEAPEFWNIIARHQTRLTDITRTHFELVNSYLTFVIRYPVLLDIQLKISLFHDLVHSGHAPPELPSVLPPEIFLLSVNRTTIVFDSVKAISDLGRDELFRSISVEFRGENGTDASEMIRDWFTCLATGLFGTSTNLFVPTANGLSLQVNRNSGTTPGVLKLFRFAGKFIALAIFHRMKINAHLASSLYKFLIGAGLTLRDMEETDESAARSIQKVLDEPVDGLMLNFTVRAERDGQSVCAELKPHGGDIMVTEENKVDYVRLCVDHYFRTYATGQIAVFLDGFFELIPQEKLAMFTEDELDLVICGIPEIDIDDLRKNCRIVEPYHTRHPVVVTFFNVIRKWSRDDLVRLLYFVTGSSQVPAGGFATLTDQRRPFAIAPGGDADRMPVAHVGWNQLDLPSYSPEHVMDKQLLCAIRNYSRFAKASKQVVVSPMAAMI